MESTHSFALYCFPSHNPSPLLRYLLDLRTSLSTQSPKNAHNHQHPLLLPHSDTYKDPPLDIVIDHELSSGKRTNHEQPGSHTGEETSWSEGLGHTDESGGDSFTGCSLGLVDLYTKVGGVLASSSGLGCVNGRDLLERRVSAG